MRRDQSAIELLFLARRVHTLRADCPRAEAIAISAGRIVAVGMRRQLLRLCQRGTRLVDVRPGVITPGLVDCHTHFLYWALHRALTIDVCGLASLEAVVSRLRAQSRTRRVGEWVLARGYDHNLWGTGLPSAADLDRAVPDRPAIVRSRDGHSAWLNSLALRRAGITRAKPDPPGGRYLRDRAGRPIGIVQEAAVDLLPDPLREIARCTDSGTCRLIDRALQAAYRTAWSYGIVGVHVMDDGASLGHLLRQRNEGALGLRIVHALPLGDLDRAIALGLRSGFGDDWLRLGGVKIFADGALGSQTAFMFDCYPGRGRYRGVPTLIGKELRRAVERAVSNGWAVWIHAIGDRAVHEAVSAVSAARRLGRPTLPHRIEHAQCVHPRDIRRMARAGIVASVQPAHILGDIAVADRHWPRARRHAYPLRRFLEAGVRLALGSDVPVESLDPRRAFFGAVNRFTLDRQPAGGWFPEQCLTTEDVLRGFTQGAAAAGGMPDGGTLAVGAPADLTIWETDPLEAPPGTLDQIGIRGCVVGGRLHLTE